MRVSRPLNIKWTLTLAIVGALFILYGLVDPGQTLWMPKCPIHFLTGFDCPGCGTQRALHAALHGDFAEAFRQNAILFLIVPYLIALSYAEMTRNRNPRFFRILYHPAGIIAVVAVILLWGIFRNI